MKIAITTGKGKIGNEIIRLLQNKATVVAGVRKPEDAEKVTALGGKAIIGDLTNENTLNQLFEGADVAFIVIPTNAMADDYVDYVLRMSRRYSTALNRAKVPKMVFLSANSYDDANLKGFMLTHKMAEEEFNKHYHGTKVFLRPTPFLSVLLYFLSEDKVNLMSPLDINKSFSFSYRPEIARRAVDALLDSKKVDENIMFRSFDKTYTINELHQVLKSSIPDLNLMPITPEQFAQGVKQSGASSSFSRCLGSTWEILNESTDQSNYKEFSGMDLKEAITNLLQN